MKTLTLTDMNFLRCKRRLILVGARFPHKLYKVVRNDGCPVTALLIMHMLSNCRKLSAPEMHHLLAHDFRPIDLERLTNFDRRYALCIQKLYHSRR